ncbi:MAG: NAD(P)-dependent oxidoreductase, partial [Planctomycetota bacterium]
MNAAHVLVTRPLFEGAMAYLKKKAELTIAPPTAEALRDKAGLICQLTDPVPAGLMDAAPELKAIANVAVGYDNIDVAAATERGIVVTNTPGVLTDTTADLTFALILAAARRIVEGDRFLRAGRFERWELDLLCGHDVHHRTLGLVGLGRIGRAVARRSKGFEMRVLFHDPTVEGSTPLEALLAES